MVERLEREAAVGGNTVLISLQSNTVGRFGWYQELAAFVSFIESTLVADESPLRPCGASSAGTDIFHTGC